MDELTASADADALTDHDAPEGYETVEAFLEETRKRFQEGVDTDRENRDMGLDDLAFMTSEGQWDPVQKAARLAKGRPCLTLNTLPQYVGQVIGDTRANRPSIKVRPAEDGDQGVAELRQGLIRYIENQSDATNVYSLAGEDQVTCGLGHFRVGLHYADDDSFNQDIRLKHIPNPFAVVWDAMSVDATGEDARFCFVVDEMPRDVFEKLYPDSQSSSLTVNEQNAGGWISRDTVRVTEYWMVKETKRTVGLVQRPGEAAPVVVDITDDKSLRALVVKDGAGRPRTREVSKRSVCMYLTNGFEILDGPYEYPIKRVPIFKVTGREVRIGSRRYRFGLIRFAKDPVRIKNMMRSAAMEWVAMAPKQQWLLHAGDKDQANRYRNSAKSGDTVLVYEGAIPPQRMDPPSSPSALLQEAQFADQDIKDVTGLHDASLGMRSNETSGKAILARERQGDVATFMYHDNLNASIRACGRVINDLLPTVFDTARTVTVLGEDEVAKSQRINDPNHPESINLGDGKYDIVVETGPSYSTKRVEAAESMMAFVQSVPAAGQAAADLIAEAQDWPGAEAIGKRLKKLLPPNLQEQDPKDMTPEQQQQRAEAAQGAQIQQQMAQRAADLDMAEREAKVRRANAEAAKIEAEARAAGAGQAQDPIDLEIKRANARKAAADADKAEADAQRARIGLADDLTELELKPMRAAHEHEDHAARHTPQAEAAAPPAPPPNDPPAIVSEYPDDFEG